VDATVVDACVGCAAIAVSAASVIDTTSRSGNGLAGTKDAGVVGTKVAIVAIAGVLTAAWDRHIEAGPCIRAGL
jgi:hypothetical protein